MVLVCHEHKFIFLKTRKTAGTSIEMMLEPYCSPPGYEVTEATPQRVSSYGIVGRRLGRRRPEDKPPIKGHAAAKQIRAVLGWWKWHRYYRFTAVRNPFDRAVSNFHWWADKRAAPMPDDFDQVRAAFRAYLDRGNMGTDRKIVHIDGKFVVQDAIRYENLQGDLDRICAKLGIRADISALPQAKSGTTRPKRRHVSEYYDAETTAIVRKRLNWMFKHYGYSTNPEDVGAHNLAKD